MSEYQYYEFQAIDRPLSEADREALRRLSTRARTTSTSFTNSYEWGDFKGDPAKVVERWFDLHLYVANWGSRRLIMKLPARLVDRDRLGTILAEVECARLEVVGENLILDIARDEVERDEFDDGTGWLAALAPLRADVLAGDLRLFYLLWLTAAETGVLDGHEPEPMPGLGPMTGALEAFADFFDIDPDLVEAAAERPAAAGLDTTSSDAARHAIAAMTDREKSGLLMRLFQGEPHLAAELRQMVRVRCETETAASKPAPRTIGDLQVRADEIRSSRERAAARKAAEERRLQAEAAEQARRARLEVLGRQGERVWQAVESEIERRNAASYDRAAALLLELRALAEEQGTDEEYRRRLQSIRERHARKERFIERLAGIGLG